MRRLFSCLFITFLFSSILIFSQESNAAQKSVQQNLDNLPIELNCKWDYIENYFIAPSEFYKNGKPQKFNLTDVNLLRIDVPYLLKKNSNYATYHCCVKDLKPNETYAIKFFRYVLGNTNFYVNGKIIHRYNKTNASLFNAKKIEHNMQLFSFTTDENGVADIVFHVTKAENGGGIIKSPMIATIYYMQTQTIKSIAFDSIVIGLLCVLALYNLLIWLHNIKLTKFFTLFLLCSNFMILIPFLNFSFFSYVTNNVLISEHFRTILFFLSMAVPLYNFHMLTVHEIKFGWDYIPLIVSLIFPIFFLCGLAIFTIETFISIMIINFILSGYLYWVIIKSLRKKSVFASIGVVFNGTIILVIVYGITIAQTFWADNVGVIFLKVVVFIFALIETFFVGIRYDKGFFENAKRIAVFEKLKDLYSQFVPTNIVNFLQFENTGNIESGINSIADGVIIAVTIKSFIDESFEVDDDRMFMRLLQYSKSVYPIINGYGGFIFKEDLDGLIIVFPEKSDKAVRCAVEMINAIKKISNKYDSIENSSIDIEIGIHSSRVAVGIMGSSDQISAIKCSSEIGVAVQISRMNEMIGSDILISEQTLEYCRPYIDVMYEGVMVTLGDTKSIVYKVVPYEHLEKDEQNLFYSTGVFE